MWQKIELRVQYMKITSSDDVVYINCFLFWHSEQFMYTTCSELVIFMYWTRNSMNNLLSHCELIDARISASEKDLPVCNFLYHIQLFTLFNTSLCHVTYYHGNKKYPCLVGIGLKLTSTKKLTNLTKPDKIFTYL